MFLTGKSEYVFEGYEIGAVRYLIKPVEERELAKALDACMEKLESCREDYLMMIVDRGYEWKESLKEMLSRLDPARFVPANRSAVVNLEFVSKITREECILENGEAIPVSRGAYGPLNDAFMKYFFK